jgi:hypothetical protein
MDVDDPKRIAEIKVTVTFVHRTDKHSGVYVDTLKGKVEPVMLPINPRNRTINN